MGYLWSYVYYYYYFGILIYIFFVTYIYVYIFFKAKRRQKIIKIAFIVYLGVLLCAFSLTMIFLQKEDCQNWMRIDFFMSDIINLVCVVCSFLFGIYLWQELDIRFLWLYIGWNLWDPNPISSIWGSGFQKFHPENILVFFNWYFEIIFKIFFFDHF